MLPELDLRKPPISRNFSQSSALTHKKIFEIRCDRQLGVPHGSECFSSLQNRDREGAAQGLTEPV